METKIPRKKSLLHLDIRGQISDESGNHAIIDQGAQEIASGEIK